MFRVLAPRVERLQGTHQGNVDCASQGQAQGADICGEHARPGHYNLGGRRRPHHRGPWPRILVLPQLLPLLMLVDPWPLRIAFWGHREGGTHPDAPGCRQDSLCSTPRQPLRASRVFVQCGRGWIHESAGVGAQGSPPRGQPRCAGRNRGSRQAPLHDAGGTAAPRHTRAHTGGAAQGGICGFRLGVRRSLARSTTRCCARPQASAREKKEGMGRRRGGNDWTLAERGVWGEARTLAGVTRARKQQQRQHSSSRRRRRS